MNITITESARNKIEDILVYEGKPDEVGLRIAVQGGGCSGFNYVFTFDGQPNEDDFTLQLDKYNVLVDAMSAQYLEGAVVDYHESLTGSRFAVDNPNAQTTCGCGSSFSPMA